MRRLALLTVALVALLALFYLGRPFSKADVRDVVDPAGTFAAPLYILASAVLGALLVPGPLLAGASGLLFGTLAGFFVGLAGAVLSALISRWIGVRAARRSTVPDHPTAVRVREHGVTAVVIQRLAPLVPDGPFNYAFGVAGVAAWPLAVGTLIGSAPRAFAYTALGSSLDHPASPRAIAAIVVIVVTGVVGAVLALRLRRAG